MYQGKGMPIGGPTQSEVQVLASLVQGQKFQDAERKTKKLLKRFPDAIVLYNILSAAQFSQENFTAAAKTLEKLLSINPGFVDGEYNLALAYINLDKSEEAVELLENVVRKKPDMAEAYNNLGAMYLKLNRFDRAVENYRTAVKLMPNFAQALRNLGVALRDLGQLEEAEKCLSKVPLLNPRFAPGHYSLGVVQRGLGKTDKAIASFKTALKLDPKLKEANYELGSIYLERREWEEAIAAFKKAKTIDSNVRVLETLFSAGRNDEVVSGLASLNHEEPRNLRAAAFSAYASHQLDTENTHPFCRKPLDFVSIRRPKSSDGDDAFFADLMEAADGLTVMWERNTTRGGFQTHGNLFDPLWECWAFSRLEEIIRDELDAYQAEHAGSEDFLITQFPNRFKVLGWRVKLMKAGFQKPHIHSGGWISGVFYLKMPNNMKGNEGSIAFSLHGYDYPVTRQNIPGKEHLPAVGDLVFFPSSLFHRTVPFEADEERQCIAFDIVPEAY